MVYQIIIALLLSLAALNMALNLLRLQTPPRNVVLPDPVPLVSVIVPARNEAKNIGACVASLMAQDYPLFEIIVLEDRSEDGTAEVVGQVAAGDSRVRLIHGGPLPDGWAGKPWACRQAADAATGEWLLFTDADTVHAPDMLRRSLSLAIRGKVSMLSGFPRQVTPWFCPRAVIPMIYFIIFSWAPLWLLHRLKMPSVAIGQFLLFPRDFYRTMGGHEVVKNRIIEDLYLGMEVSRRGGRHLAVDLSDIVSCRMYGDLGEVWLGLTRTLYGVSAISPLALAGLLVAGSACFLGPFLWLGHLLMASSAPAWAPLVLLQVILLFIMRRAVDARFRESWLTTLTFPAGIVLIIAVVISGMARQLGRRGVYWKNRPYGKGT